jgi:hypothetical protein
MSRSSKEHFDELAQSIQAMPISIARATVAELRDAGLEDEAAEIEKLVAVREAKLDAARAAKTAEEQAEHDAAVAAARGFHATVYAEYMKTLNDAAEALAQYSAVASNGNTMYGNVGVAYQRLAALLGANSPDLPEFAPAPQDFFRRDPRLTSLKF